MQEFITRERLVTCEACGTRVPIKEMKFDITGTELICTTCHEKQRKRSSSSYTRSQLGPSLSFERRMERASAVESYVFYQCGSCSYRFSRKQDVSVRICPYCASEKVRLRSKNDAQQVIDESHQVEEWGIEFLGR